MLAITVSVTNTYSGPDLGLSNIQAFFIYPSQASKDYTDGKMKLREMKIFKPLAQQNGG